MRRVLSGLTDLVFRPHLHSLVAIIKDAMAEREAIWVVSQHQVAPPA